LLFLLLFVVGRRSRGEATVGEVKMKVIPLGDDEDVHSERQGRD